MVTSATNISRSSVNRSSEAASLSRNEAGVEDSGGRRVLAITESDFPRVLNGPAPGYAEDALRRLALATLPAESADAFVDAVRVRNRRGALKKAPTSINQAIEEGVGSVNGVPRVEPGPFERVPGLEGHIRAALSEGFSAENMEDEEEEEENQQVVNLMDFDVSVDLAEKYLFDTAVGDSMGSCEHLYKSSRHAQMLISNEFYRPL